MFSLSDRPGTRSAAKKNSSTSNNHTAAASTSTSRLSGLTVPESPRADVSGEEALARLRRQSNLSTLSLSPRRPSSNGTTSTGTVTRDKDYPTGSKRRASALRGSVHSFTYQQDDSFDASMDDEELPIGDDDDGAATAQDEWSMVDRMRNWRNDAMTQHLYGTAEFWGSKVFEMTGSANDAFWLAQTHFMTHQYAAAERILTTPRSPTGQRSSSLHRRLTDTSLACRYLAAQCQVRLGKWEEALDLVGRQTGIITDVHATDDQHSDGGIKLSASMAHLRGLIHLHQGSSNLAKDAFVEALLRDVKCFESYQMLTGSEMLTTDEEWDLIQNLQYRNQLGPDADFVKMMYTIKLRKIKKRPAQSQAREALAEQYGLADDPDVLYSRAEELYTAMRYAECFKLTTRILRMHATHRPTLKTHVACMMQLPGLRSKLFLLAHDLVEQDPDDAITWYAVGCWYFAGKRWDEARKFFGKSVLIDSRFGPAWIAFAHSYAYEGEHDQAITAYSTALRHLQGSHLPLLFIGMQHLGLGGLTTALEYLTSAKECCEDDPLVWNELGVAHVKLGKHLDAIDHFQRALVCARSVEQAPTSLVTILLNLGHALRRAGFPSDARPFFNQVLALDSRCASAYSALGYIDHADGKFHEAVAHYHDALAISPADPVTCDLLRLVLEDAASEIVPGAEAYPGLPARVLDSIDEQVLELDRDIMLGRQPLLPEEMEDISHDRQERHGDASRAAGHAADQSESFIMMDSEDGDEEGAPLPPLSSSSDMGMGTRRRPSDSGEGYSIEMDEGSATFESMHHAESSDA